MIALKSAAAWSFVGSDGYRNAYGKFHEIRKLYKAFSKTQDFDYERAKGEAKNDKPKSSSMDDLD
jgi:hypothetical protein